MDKTTTDTFDLAILYPRTGEVQVVAKRIDGHVLHPHDEALVRAQAGAAILAAALRDQGMARIEAASAAAIMVRDVWVLEDGKA